MVQGQGNTIGMASGNGIKSRLDQMIDMSDSESDTESISKKRPLLDDEEAAVKTETNEPVEELLKVKRKRYVKPFTEELLVNPNGLEKIYNEFPLYCPYDKRSFSVPYKPNAHASFEGEYLKRLLSKYKEWAFQLHPGVSFPDVINKCELLGSRGRIRGYVARLRERERDRYMNEVLIPIAQKQTKYAEIQERKMKNLEELKKREEEERQFKENSTVKDSQTVNKSNDEGETGPFTVSAEDDWDPFAVNLSKYETTEIPTQLDESFLENELPWETQQSLSANSANLNEEMRNETLAKKSSKVEEDDIFGDDSDEEPCEAPTNDVALSEPEVDTFPQD